MSYDINFWKLESPTAESSVEIYRSLCQRRDVSGLSTLPVQEIISRLKAAFPAYDPNEKFPSFQTAKGGIEVSHSEKHFRFDLRGDCWYEAQKLVDLMGEFNCPVYDPQLDRRYDSADGMSLGKKPEYNRTANREKIAKFRAQAEALEALRQQALVRIAAMKKGSSSDQK